jgi:16S rRNA (uracil1498-N3)-methyltransferase
MRQFRFITERHNLTPGSSVLLTDEEASHANRTLRLSKGDEIFLFNGEREYKAVLKRVAKDVVMAEIIEEVTDNRPDRNLFISLYVGMPKVKHFETILEKGTELGVTRFIPVNTEYSVIKPEALPKKYKRWEKIVASACKQSERIDIPEIAQPISFAESIKDATSNQKNYLFTLNRGKKELQKLKKITDESKRIGIFIGPEGGFSPSEVEEADEFKHINTYTLFEEVLRTETAAISAVSIVRFLYEMS